MKKTFILDTNVLLHDPKAIFSFGPNLVVIPIFVLEEIDNFKKELSELGQNARNVSRKLDELREKGSLSLGVNLENNGTLQVLSPKGSLEPLYGLKDSQDNRILALALFLKKTKENEEVIFITQDINLRIKADSLGITATNFEPEPVTLDELYSGVMEVDGQLEENSIKNLKLKANQFLHIKEDDNKKNYFRYINEKARPILKKEKEIWGILPKNPEQQFALDLLMDDSVQLVTLVGKAGTGKTLLAMACGLQLVAEERRFQRLLVSRPIFPLGRDLGYLPGTIEEKLNPWMQPIFDNIEFLMTRSRASLGRHRSKTNYQDLMEIGLLQIEPLTYIRGRSIASQFLIVDEAQNLTPHEVKTIISRAGEGTKVVLTGDPYQIDNPYVDATNNGLVHVVNRFLGQNLYGHITLRKGERSVLAESAANLL